ncbi:MAG: hypothetical protein AB1673_00980 [Actinomycetota bacterium]|jgi:hypothetical protein
MRRTFRVVAAVAAAVMLVGCGDGGGEGAATNKAEWEAQHGELVAAYSRDLTAVLNTINQGERTTTMATCNQVIDDANEVKEKALPVPNAAVDTALRKAVDIGLSAADNCLKGARNTEAHAVEVAQREFAEAREAMDEAEAAIEAWT